MHDLELGYIKYSNFKEHLNLFKFTDVPPVCTSSSGPALSPQVGLLRVFTHSFHKYLLIANCVQDTSLSIGKAAIAVPSWSLQVSVSESCQIDK